MTLREWKTVADGITKETEERARRGEPYAKEDAILSAERRYGLEFVELAPDGSVIGLIEKKGSKWALFVGISCDRHRVLVYSVMEPNEGSWTPRTLQKVFGEAVFNSI